MANSLSILAGSLPRVAEEGQDHEVLAESELILRLTAAGLEECSAASVVAMVRRFLQVSSCLDEAEAAAGRWRFVSFPSYLFARSVLSGAEGTDYRLLERGFWESPQQNGRRQHDLLHRIELNREASSGSYPPKAIRRVWVAWAIMVIDGRFLLVSREDNDPERADSMGAFVFPGGRVAPGDLLEPSHSRRLDFFDPAVAKMAPELRPVLTRTLERELKEELDLDHGDLLSTEAVGETIAYQALEGSNAAHAVTDYFVQPFHVDPNPRGKQALLRRLAERKEQFAWFSPAELAAKRNAGGQKAFVNALLQDANARSRVLDEPSRFELRLGQSDAGDEEVDIPVSPQDRLAVGETSRERVLSLDLSDREFGILAFQAAARRSEHATELRDDVHLVPGLGWVIIDDRDLMRECRSLASRLETVHASWKPLSLEGNAIRLNTRRPEQVFFGASVFSLSIKPERSGDHYELRLTRNPIHGPLGGFAERSESQIVARKLGQSIHQLAAGDPSFALEHWDSIKRMAQELTPFCNRMGLRRLLRQEDGVPFLSVGAMQAD